jgi:hypothetical protein
MTSLLLSSCTTLNLSCIAPSWYALTLALLLFRFRLLSHFIAKLVVVYNVFEFGDCLAVAYSLSIAYSLSLSLSLPLTLALHRQTHSHLQCISPVTFACTFSSSFGDCVTVACSLSLSLALTLHRQAHRRL